jgi:hypothetical protein
VELLSCVVDFRAQIVFLRRRRVEYMDYVGLYSFAITEILNCVKVIIAG